MIGRRRLTAPDRDPWDEEGRRLAPQLAGLSAVVVAGLPADAAARVALGAARAIAGERRVAVADLAGAAALRAAVTPDAAGTEAPGITESFAHGISLNEVARPAADGTPGLFILPLGGEPLTVALLQSDRWGRLVAGFADAGALLLIVAQLDTPGLDALVPRTDGVVAVGSAEVPIAWRVIALVGEQAAPAESADTTRRPHRPARRRARGVAVVGLVLVAAVAVAWRTGRLRAWLPHTDAATSAPAGAAPGTAVAVGEQTPGRNATVVPPADTLRVPDPVNPPDSAIAAQFAVELVATNTVTGANSWIREHGARLPGITVSPVVLGAARVRWFKVIAGAWRERAGADSLLAALRGDGVLRREAGVVVRVPLTLVLEVDVPREAANARVAALAARGVRAYALLQDDGSVRLCAGAFETAAAVVPLDADLRSAGLAPQVAYRTGRTF